MKNSCLYIFLGCILAVAQSVKAVDIGTSTCRVSPTRHAVYRYPAGAYIAHPDQLEERYKVGGSDLHFAPSTDQYWLALPLTNVDTIAVRFLLELESTLIDELQFFWVSDGKVEASPKNGDNIPPALIQRSDPRFVYEMELEGLDSGVLYVMALKSGTSLVLDYRIWGERCYAQRYLQNEFITLLALGGMLVMLILSLFFLFYSKDVIFIYYSLYMASAIMLLLLFSGYGLYVVWKDRPALNNPGYFYGASLILSMLLYVSKYISLGKSQRLSSINKVFVTLLSLTMVMSLVYQHLPQDINARLIIVASLLFLSVVLWIPYTILQRYWVDRDRTYFLVLGAYFWVLLSIFLYSVEEMGEAWSRLSVATRSVLFLFVDSIIFLLLIGVKFRR